MLLINFCIAVSEVNLRESVSGEVNSFALVVLNKLDLESTRGLPNMMPRYTYST
jgi:hypothetical protein